MPVNYYTLKALCKELDLTLRNATIEEILTQSKNELLFNLQVENIETKAAQVKTLRISTEPKFNYIYFSDYVTRAKRNSVDLFNQIKNSRIQDFDIHASDRILFVTLNTQDRIIIKLFDTSESNVLLVDEKNNVIESFKRNKELRGSIFNINDKDNRILSALTFEVFKDQFLKVYRGNLITTLKNIFPNLKSTYIKEVLYRTQISSSSVEFNTEIIKLLWDEIQNIILQLSNPIPVIIHLNESEKIFSLIELHHLGDKKKEKYDSVSKAIKSFVIQKYNERKFQVSKLEIAKSIGNDITKSESSLNKIKEQKLVSHIDYENCGKLILSNLHLIKKGMKEIDLPDPINGAKIIHISLDPSLTPTENAERYFNKSKKEKLAAGEMKKRINYLQERIQILKNLYDDLEKCSTMHDVENFYSVHNAKLKELNLLKDKQQESLPPFRIFKISDQYEVWVGKNSKNNDLLTMKYSKPNDIWFHARGVSGSHTVLKVKNKSNKVPKEIIQRAASIAAYYSKMRKSSNVPVSYCERKYVHKPKGAAEGVVTLDREEVIFVSPTLS